MKIKRIDTRLLDEVSAQAKVNPRLRMNYNFHQKLDDPVNRMLNAIEPGTYARPHRHLDPPKIESFVLLRGALDLLIFDDEGNVIQRERLSHASGMYGMDIEPGIWHTVVAIEPDTVMFEVKTGPYVAINDKDFAPWSPEPDDAEGVLKYLERLRTGAI